LSVKLGNTKPIGKRSNIVAANSQRRSLLTGLVAVFSLSGLFAQVQSDQADPVKGVEFRITSATLAPLPNYDRIANLHFTISMSNTRTSAIGLFLVVNETSASLDSGISFHDAYLKASGIAACNMPTRQQCLQNKDAYMVTLAPKANANIIIEMTTSGLQDASIKKLIMAATAADLACVLYMVSADGDAGFVPLTFPDISIHNSFR
jgi:hypothetical protein